ncbi:hypothetical protein ACFYXM_24860 [Streptomyces sp. NPDC002476]|uniref:hypothetical protein n=1 Tax=Streptomyces sp. NPDC002476 TaxID=3364648 RepID=UPI00369F3738
MRERAAGADRSGGRFVLHRFNGDEVYRIAFADIWVCAAEGSEGPVTLWFEVAADSDGARRCEDTEALGMAPTAEVGVELPGIDVDALVGREFVMPGVRDDDEDSCMSLLYYCEHQPLRDNRINVLSRDGDRFRLRWTARTQDVNYYDGSKPPTRIEIEGDFLFKRARG